MISPFREDSIFTKLRISRKKNARENFRIYSYLPYATYIDVDRARYVIIHANIGKGGKMTAILDIHVHFSYAYSAQYF